MRAESSAPIVREHGEMAPRCQMGTPTPMAPEGDTKGKEGTARLFCGSNHSVPRSIRATCDALYGGIPCDPGPIPDDTRSGTGLPELATGLGILIPIDAIGALHDLGLAIGLPFGGALLGLGPLFP